MAKRKRTIKKTKRRTLKSINTYRDDHNYTIKSMINMIIASDCIYKDILLKNKLSYEDIHDLNIASEKLRTAISLLHQTLLENELLDQKVDYLDEYEKTIISLNT